MRTRNLELTDSRRSSFFKEFVVAYFTRHMVPLNPCIICPIGSFEQLTIFVTLHMNILKLWIINFSTSSLRTSEYTNLAVVRAIETADVRIFV